MSIFVNDFIISAFNLTNAFTQENIPQKFDIAEALTILNEWLSSAPTAKKIPFYQTIDITLTPAKYKYTFGNAVGVDFVQNRIVSLVSALIVWNQVTYPLTVVDKFEYYEVPKPLNISSIPRIIILENSIQDISTLTLFPAPNINYDFQFRAKIDLAPMSLQSYVTQVPAYYLRFLRYQLARDLCDVYPAGKWTERKEAEYQQLKQQIEIGNDLDLTIKTTDAQLMYNQRKLNILSGL